NGRMARVWLESNQPQQALETYRASLANAEKLHESIEQLDAALLRSLGEFHHEYANLLRQIHPSEGLAQAYLALEALQRAYALRSADVEYALDLSQAHSDLGAALQVNGRMPEAI